MCPRVTKGSCRAPLPWWPLELGIGGEHFPHCGAWGHVDKGWHSLQGTHCFRVPTAMPLDPRLHRGYPHIPCAPHEEATEPSMVFQAGWVPVKAALCQPVVSASPTASSDVAVLAQQRLPHAPSVAHSSPHCLALQRRSLCHAGDCHHPWPQHMVTSLQCAVRRWLLALSRHGVERESLPCEHLQPHLTHNPSSRGWISKRCSASLPHITPQTPPHGDPPAQHSPTPAGLHLPCERVPVTNW